MYNIALIINFVLLIYVILVLIKPNKFMPFLKATPFMKRLCVVGGYIIFWVILANVFSDDIADKKKAQAEAAKQDSIKTEQEVQRILIKEVKDDSIALAKGDYYTLSGNPTIQEIKELLSKHNHIELQGGANNPERENTLEYVKSEEKKQWEKAMPSIRKAFVKITKAELWESDIDVYDSNGGKTIWFVGGTFAANRNIKAYHERFEKILKQLGFKRACYKWIEHTDEYTYYDL